MKSFILVFVFLSYVSSSVAQIVAQCGGELGDLVYCLAQTSPIETVQECVDCAGQKFGEELTSVTSCETFNFWYCNSTLECVSSCGTGCGGETLALAVCILTEGGQTPPQDDCLVECIGTVVGGESSTSAPSPSGTPSSPTVTVCSEDGVNRCSETFQVCYKNTDGGEVCGNCLNRYIEFPPEDENPPCVLIEDLPWEDFFNYFQENDPPFYLEELTDEERLKLLYIVMRIISAENSRIPPLPYKLGINKFAADTETERKSLLGFLFDQAAADEFGNQFGRFPAPTNRELQNLPSERNWVKDGAVTQVKDQGRCGCCWAESVMGAAEGAVAITPESKGFLQSLSTQQLISCDKNNLGCNGGSIVYATGYSWKEELGLASYNDYPFTDYGGTTTEECALADRKATARIDDPVYVTTYSDSLSFEERVLAMKSAVARQPVSVALKSDCSTFSYYRDGIMTNDGACACESTSCIDHAVLLVGYSDNSDPPYWLLKNSWGTGWGENGYFRISQQGGGNWGLFGMLGEGVVPLKGTNTTAQTIDEPDSSSPMGHHSVTWLPILVMVVATLVW